MHIKDINIDKQTEKYIYKTWEKNFKVDNVYFADYEAFTQEQTPEGLKPLHHHIANLLCYQSLNNHESVFTNSIKELIKEIKYYNYRNVIIYFHNLDYDAQFITCDGDYNIQNPIIANNKLISFTL